MSRERAQALLTQHFGPFGPLRFPYYRMGNVDSLHLFGDTELMIMALYWENRKRWHRALDIGANIGLHSILMARLGWTVRAYEPDHASYARLVANLEANGLHAEQCEANLAAVHTAEGEADFVRVLDNLTGNHLAGFKYSYGPRETVRVRTVDCRPLFDWADFAKIDCEGNEADLMLTTTREQMAHLSMVAEVRDRTNALRVYQHFMELEVPLWSQKRDWRRVSVFGDMPESVKDGSLFVGHCAPF